MISGLAVGVAVLITGTPPAGGSADVVEPRRGLAAAAMLTPHRVARPRHLESTYVAPSGASARAWGRLRVDRLGVDAPVIEVGWDGDTMAVPNDPKTLGWLGSSAHLDDQAGTSLIASHVADPRGRSGALAVLAQARVGDTVEWRGSNSSRVRFRVTAIERFPRSAGLPVRLFAADGPHVLRLVTCTHKVRRASGFHYTDNLVVSAVAIGR